MSDRPKKSVRVNPETKVREFNFLNKTARVAANGNKSVPIIYGKNARGFSAFIPSGNTRKEPIYLPNNNGGIFTSLNAMTADPNEYAAAAQLSKESLYRGENVPTIHRTRRQLQPIEAFNKKNRKRDFMNLVTFRNARVNKSPLKNYESYNGNNINNIMQEGVNAYIASGQENRNHAQYTAALNTAEAVRIAEEAAMAAAANRGFRRTNGSRNLTQRRRKSARKTRKARR